jgi:hypothetical protein
MSSAQFMIFYLKKSASAKIALESRIGWPYTGDLLFYRNLYNKNRILKEKNKEKKTKKKDEERKPINKIIEVKNGYTVYYIVLNPNFNEYLDGGESYLEPMQRHIDCLYEKIGNHYLIYSEHFVGLGRYVEHLAIADDKETAMKKCLEEAQKLSQKLFRYDDSYFKEEEQGEFFNNLDWLRRREKEEEKRKKRKPEETEEKK